MEVLTRKHYAEIVDSWIGKGNIIALVGTIPHKVIGPLVRETPFVWGVVCVLVRIADFHPIS